MSFHYERQVLMQEQIATMLGIVLCMKTMFVKEIYIASQRPIRELMLSNTLIETSEVLTQTGRAIWNICMIS